jgi:two-component system, OmpR family, phosphate regulon sensor histidine kinase PhoR
LRTSFRAKLLLVATALVLAALAAADHFLSNYVRALTVDQARAELAQRLALLVHGPRTADAFEESGRCARCDRVAEAVTPSGQPPALVRVVGPEGRVLARSADVTPAHRPRGLPDVGLAAEGSGGRVSPELAAALQGADGAQIRISGGKALPILAAAIALPPERGERRALHVTRPLFEVERALVGLQNRLGRGLIGALLVVLLVALVGPRLLSRELRDVIETANRMSRGELAVRTQLEPSDPYAPLGRALDQLAENLSRTVTRLREESDLLARILDAMEEGVLVLDEDRRVILLNRALSTMLLVDPRTAGRTTLREPGGGPPSPLDVKGKSLLEITLNADLEGLLDRTSRQPPRASAEIEVGDLKPRRLLVRAARLSGAAWGFLVVAVDVTEMRRLESLRRDFVANVSHELRTPIASVSSAAETLRSALHRDPAAADRFLAIIERNAERLSGLVEDLLDLSRIESREYRLQIEPLDVDRVVADVLALFRERAESRSLVLRKEIPPGLAPLATDRRALEQVLVNLVDNAVKYVPPGASITVRAEPAGEALRLLVIDSGQGIEARHLPRLFERFYRIDSGRSRDRGGSGLGLAIVKHLVEAMGGTVAVESQVGAGTTFRIELPARPRR